MDITKVSSGAIVDVTDESEHQINRLADAFADNADVIVRLLGQLSDARADVRSARSGDLPDWQADSKAEAAEQEAEGFLAEIVALLDPADRVQWPVMAAGCERYARAFTAAAERPLVGSQAGDVVAFPHQRAAGQDAA
jgi:hypothetical protein